MKLSQTTRSCPGIWDRANGIVPTEACVWTGLSQVTIHLPGPEACGDSVCWEAWPRHHSPACPMLSFLCSQFFLPSQLQSASHCALGCSAHNRRGSDIKLWVYKLNRSNFQSGYQLAKHYHEWANCKGDSSISLRVPDTTGFCVLCCMSVSCLIHCVLWCVLITVARPASNLQSLMLV
jgi:hypothetical protein